MSKKTAYEWEPPANAYELTKSIGAEPDEGVVVALFSEVVSEVAMTGEPFKVQPGVLGYGLIGKVNGEDRLLDVVTEPRIALKWWKITDFARSRGYNEIGTVWEGPIRDTPDEYFGPQVNRVVGLRLYSEGPWFWPHEQPEIQMDQHEDDIRVQKMVEKLNLLKGYVKNES